MRKNEKEAALHTSPLMWRLFITIRAVPINGLASFASNKILISFVSQSKPRRMIRCQNAQESVYEDVRKLEVIFQYHCLKNWIRTTE